MSHEITAEDGMFSTLETPWHGLGEVLDSPPTIDEAIRAANLGWTVEARPLFTESGMPAPARGIVRMDNETMLGVVGTRYEPLQNLEAFSVFQPLLKSGDLSLETGGSLKGGKRVWILARILSTDAAEVGGSGDEVRPYVLLSNSHDGKQAVRLGFTPIRVVCNNTLTAAEGSKKSQLIKVAHLKNVLDTTLELTSIMDLHRANFEATIEQYRRLASKAVDTQDLRQYVRLAFAPMSQQTADGVTINEDDLKVNERRVIELFDGGKSAEGTGENLWRAYNAVNEFLAYERGPQLDQDERLHSLWFAEAQRIDERAMNVALRLAA